MRDHLTMQAYDMNDAPLSSRHGAPLQVCNEVWIGFKQVKWPAGIECAARFSEVGGATNRR